MGELSGSLQTVREGLDALDSSLEKCVLMTCQRHHDCTDFMLADCAKNFVRRTRPCKQAFHACSVSSKSLMFCDEHLALQPSQNDYRLRWRSFAMVRTVPERTQRHLLIVRRWMAVEVRRPDWIMKENESACSPRPRSPLRSSVGTPLYAMSPIIS